MVFPKPHTKCSLNPSACHTLGNRICSHRHTQHANDEHRRTQPCLPLAWRSFAATRLSPSSRCSSSCVASSIAPGQRAACSTRTFLGRMAGPPSPLGPWTLDIPETGHSWDERQMGESRLTPKVRCKGRRERWVGPPSLSGRRGDGTPPPNNNTADFFLSPTSTQNVIMGTLGEFEQQLSKNFRRLCRKEKFDCLGRTGTVHPLGGGGRTTPFEVKELADPRRKPARTKWEVQSDWTQINQINQRRQKWVN